jgi:hypothetical protein
MGWSPSFCFPFVGYFLGCWSDTGAQGHLFNERAYSFASFRADDRETGTYGEDVAKLARNFLFADNPPGTPPIHWNR